MNIITLDFETFYDRTFSLSKLTTEEYIRNELFETIGVGVKVNDGETQWFSGPKRETKAFLDQFPWDQSVAVAHNAMFDMAILNWHFDIRPKRIADTLSMLRAIDGPDAGNSLAKAAERYGLGAKGDEVVNALGKGRLDFTPEELARYGQYCINDVELTYELFKRIASLIPPLEFRLIDLTIRMFSEPVLELDKDVLTTHLTEVKAKKEKLLSVALVHKDELMSNPKLAELLRKCGVEPPMKISPTTGKETYAFSKTDEGFKALLEHENIIVQNFVAARMGVKSTLEETRTERFISIADRGTLPVPLKYYGAHTGRWSADGSLNLQNLPRKSKLKRAINAPKGYAILDCDSSQIEARTLAWVAGQDDLVEFFAKNNEEIAAGVPKEEMQYDPYKIMASQVYSCAVNDVDPDRRQVGKVAVLGAGYGLGWKKFKVFAKQQGVDADDDFARRTIDVYRSTFPMIPALWKEGDAALEAMCTRRTAPLGREGVLVVGDERVQLPNTLFLRYPNLRKEADPVTGYPRYVYDAKKGRATFAKGVWGGSLTENFCQALARIIIGEQMLMVARRLRVVMTVHDSVVALVPEAEAGEAQTFVEQCMRMRPKWATGLPLNCESKMGATYGG
jgi:DNA polymerase I-like protein with 3'-5' exonuclease and polymerase domains